VDKIQNEAISSILDGVSATGAEKTLISYANTAVTKEINHSQVISTFLLTKQLEKTTKEVIESNKLLANANDKTSNKMVNLTWALVFVGVIQAISALIDIFKKWS
jgi:hypothetical protein